MKKNVKKRLAIFQEYASQWEVLKRNNQLKGIDQKFVSNYVCPICLEHFSPKDLNQGLSNPLTLEDAPPKSLGGKANTLTCKSCNNFMGKEIDSHLAFRLNNLDRRNFSPNTKSKVKIWNEDKSAQATIEVDDKGTIKVIHSNKNNHPQKLEEFIKTINPHSKNPVVSVEFLGKPFNPLKFQYAILKTAYLLIFERFGYIFLLDKAYNNLREQLLNPNKRIYPTKFWNEDKDPKEMCGVHFITEKHLESILVIFPIKTQNKERIITAILPLPINKISNVLKVLKRRSSKQGGLYQKAYAFNPNNNYLRDYDQMKTVINWIKRKKRKPRIK